MREEKGAEHWLGEILAVLHGDGGQYIDEVGMESATREAIALHYQLVEDLDRYQEALKEIARTREPARMIAQEALENREEITGGEIMSKEKSTQKSGEGFPNTKIYGPKGGNPTNGGGINRPTKGQG